MGYCEMPFCYNGAIFYSRDFDAKKLLVYCLEYDGVKKSLIKKIKRLPSDKPLSKRIRLIIEKVICTDDAKTLKELEEYITEDLACDLVGNCGLDGLDYMVRRFDSSEKAEFYGEHLSDDDINGCFFITIPSTFPWKITEYTGPKNEEEAAKYVKARIGHLVKDGIDWTKRLGELSGIYPN